MSLKSIGDIDPLEWAAYPRSSHAFEAVLLTAKDGDLRFNSILAKLVKDGVCTAEGKLLAIWKNGSWVAA